MPASSLPSSSSSHAKVKLKLSYADEKDFAKGAFAKVDESIPNLILDYLGAKEPDKTMEDYSYLLIAKDMMGQNIEQAEYMQVVKNLVLDIVCQHPDMTQQIIATYSQAIDRRLEATANFDEALDLLTNHFIYDPICQGRITHSTPLNALCLGSKIHRDPVCFTQLKNFLKILGVNVNVYDRFLVGNGDYRTPLHHLLSYNDTWGNLSIACIEELLQNGADINIKTSRKLDTPLHLAVRDAHVEAVRFLVNVPKINLLAKNAEGISPLEEARRLSVESPTLGEKRSAIIQILTDAIKHSHPSGTKRGLLSHCIKQTLLGDSKNALDKLDKKRYEIARAITPRFPS